MALKQDCSKECRSMHGSAWAGALLIIQWDFLQLTVSLFQAFSG